MSTKSGKNILYTPRGILVKRGLFGIPRPLGATLENVPCWSMRFEHNMARISNPWVFLLGPLYLFIKKLWRKALLFTLFFLTLFILLPIDHGRYALTAILQNHYAGVLLGFVLPKPLLAYIPALVPFVSKLPFLGIQLGAVLFMCHRWFWGAILCIYAISSFILYDLLSINLSLGVAEALPWLVGHYVWPLLIACFGYALMGYRVTLVIVLGCCMLGAWLGGLPWHDLDISFTARTMLFMLFVLMTELDLYRKRVLSQRFWW